jgi:hypothetical protein
MWPTRLILWCLAYHADSETASTTVNSYTLTKEVGCSHNTLDRALYDLILAGLVSQSARIDQIRIVGSNSRTINASCWRRKSPQRPMWLAWVIWVSKTMPGFTVQGRKCRMSTPVNIESGAPMNDSGGKTEKATGGEVRRLVNGGILVYSRRGPSRHNVRSPARPPSHANSTLSEPAPRVNPGSRSARMRKERGEFN